MLKRYVSLVFAFLLIYAAGEYFYSIKLGPLEKGDRSDVIQTSAITKIPTIKFTKLYSKSRFKISAEKSVKVFHFWATWCGPCLAEFPQVSDLSDRLSRISSKKINVYFVAVNDTEKDLKRFLKQFDVNTAVMLEDKEDLHKKDFGVYKLPETMVFNESGDLVRHYVGPQEWKNPKYINEILNITQ